MSKLRKIYDILEREFPSNLKEEWDNVGLMVGDLDCEISKVLVALDCTMDVIDEAISIGANLIITHHPFIFSPLFSIDYSLNIGKKIKKITDNNINVLSYHTNFDKAKCGTAYALAKILDLFNIKNLSDAEFSLGRIGEIAPCSLEDFLNEVKIKLNIPNLKYIGDEEKIISKVAVIPGSGSDFYKEAIECGADAVVTSEVKHHIAIECMECGIAIIDAGHFETENIALYEIESLLSCEVETVISKKYTKLFKYI